MGIEENQVHIKKQFLEKVAEYDNVYDLIFTSFNFSPAFFEDSIICELADVEKIRTPRDIDSCNRWLKQRNVSVFYDSSVLSDSDKRLTYNTYEVLEKGFFHPKVIVIYGDKKGKDCCDIFVMSANLSVSGWGRNIECISEVEVNNRELAGNLREFLLKTFERGKASYEPKNGKNIFDHLSSIKTKGNGEVMFFSTYSNSESLTKFLITQASRKLTVISPYFSGDLKGFIEANYNDFNLTLIPAISEDKVGIKKEAASELKDKVSFKRLKFDNDGFAHAKVYLTDDHIIIGSHNFTEAGAGNATDKGIRNVEASLIFKNNGIGFNSLDFNDIEEYCLEDNEEWENEFNIEKKRISCSVTADWKRRIFTATFTGDIKGCTIRLPGLYETPIISEEFEVRFEDKTLVELVKKKHFEVYRNDRLEIKGLINEKNWINYRQDLRLTSLDACLDCWMEDNLEAAESRATTKGARLLGDGGLDDEEGDIELPGESKDIFDNFFYLFKAFHSIEKIIEKSRGSLEELIRIFRTTPGSISDIIYNVKEKEKTRQEEDGVWFWIVYNELRNLLNKLKLYMEDKKDEEMTRDIEQTLRDIEGRIGECPSRDGVFVEWVTKELGYEVR